METQSPPSASAGSIRSEQNLIHLIDSEQYTPSQVLRAVQTAIDDNRSFNFDKVVLLPRVQCLRDQPTQGASSEPSQSQLVFDLLMLMARGDFPSYLKNRQRFAPVMDQHPGRAEKLRTICKRKLQTALNSPDTFDFCAFLDLLQHPLCKNALAEEDAKQLLPLLDLMAFRTVESPQYGEYVKAGLRVAPDQLDKLRKVSFASFAAECKKLSYADLQKRLQFKSEDELEDFLIDAMGSEVVTGSIDQRHKVVFVTSCIARHVQRDSIGALVEKLDDWSKITGQLVQKLEDKMRQLQSVEGAKVEREAELLQRIETALAKKSSS